MWNVWAFERPQSPLGTILRKFSLSSKLFMGKMKNVAIEIKSIHSAQGSEARIVILSTTRPRRSLGMGLW